MVIKTLLLKEIAKEARKKAEKMLGSDLSAKCYEANRLLAEELKKHGFRARVYDGFYKHKGELLRHFYVIADGKIVDIAADQFGRDKVVVTELDDPSYE